MTTLSQRLGLKKHTLGDVYRTVDYTENWGVLDGCPGIYVCTSTNRPAWAAAQAGMFISETDTGLLWRWSGTAWVRAHLSGRLGRTAVATDVSTSSTTAVTAVSTTVTVPDGNRPVLVVAQGPGVYSTVNLTRISLWRGATQIQSWLQNGRSGTTAAEQPTPLTMTVDDTPPTGSVAYTLRFQAEIGFGGTSTLHAASGKPLALSVVGL